MPHDITLTIGLDFSDRAILLLSKLALPKNSKEPEGLSQLTDLFSLFMPSSSPKIDNVEIKKKTADEEEDDVELKSEMKRANQKEDSCGLKKSTMITECLSKCMESVTDADKLGSNVGNLVETLASAFEGKN